MTESDIKRRVEVVRDNLDRLAAIPQASFEEFSADFRNLDSTLHRLQTAIQALLDIGAILVARLGLPSPRTSIEIVSVLEEAGRLPPGTSAKFRPLLGFRNRVVHLYDRVNEEHVYRILTEERGDIADFLELLLDAAEN